MIWPTALHAQLPEGGHIARFMPYCRGRIEMGIGAVAKQLKRRGEAHSEAMTERVWENFSFFGRFVRKKGYGPGMHLDRGPLG